MTTTHKTHQKTTLKELHFFNGDEITLKELSLLEKLGYTAIMSPETVCLWK